MPIITKISVQKRNPEKRNIYLDGEYFISMKERVVKYLGLTVGMKVTKEDLCEKESQTFKKLYSGSWEKEKERIEISKGFIKEFNPDISIKEIGFGADTTEFLDFHPESKDKSGPDLKVGDFYVEVTGTDFPAGNELWVRKDKVDYILNNSDKKIFVFVLLGKKIHILDITNELLNNRDVKTKHLKDNFPEYYYEFNVSESIDISKWRRDYL